MFDHAAGSDAVTDSPRIRCAVLSAVKHDYVARGIAAHPRFELVVVADDPQVPEWAHQRNQQLADEFAIPYVRDVGSALREFDIRVAIVSSEAERHCDLSTRAALAGVHIVQDKPLSTMRSEVERLTAAIRKSNVRFMMWNRNAIPALIQARNQIASGSIGQISSLHMDFYFAKDAGPPIGTRRPDDPPLDWLTYQIAAHRDGSDGGLGSTAVGELTNEGIYPLACLRMLTGRPVRRVFARSTAHFHQINADNHVEDLASLTLEFEGGILGSVTIGRIGSASMQSVGEIKLRVLGSEGALTIDEALPVVSLFARTQPPHEPQQRRIANDNDFLLAQDFYESITMHRPSMLDIDDSRETFLTVEAACESCRSGRTVDIRTRDDN